VLDAAKRVVTLVCAGERPVVVYRQATRTCERVLPNGPALGTAAPAVFDRKLTEAGVKLAPGDFLLCATSGVDGAVNAQQEAFGAQRLVTTLRSAAGFAAQGIAEMVERAVQAFAGSAPQPRDLAMILIKPEGSDRA
jgi:serine phosphatase RsbU (regulator of sigma subunit)